jgi:hypothetical protein
MNTYLIVNSLCENINKNVSYKLNDISYSFDENEDPDDVDEKEFIDDLKRNTNDLNLRNRTRGISQKANDNEKARLPNQLKLRKLKCEELRKRFNKNTLIKDKNVDNINLDNLTS